MLLIQSFENIIKTPVLLQTVPALKSVKVVFRREAGDVLLLTLSFIASILISSFFPIILNDFLRVFKLEVGPGLSGAPSLLCGCVI